MNSKTIKKIRKEINSKENEMVNQIFNYFNSLSFGGRLKIAMRILRKKI